MKNSVTVPWLWEKSSKNSSALTKFMKIWKNSTNSTPKSLE